MVIEKEQRTRGDYIHKKLTSLKKLLGPLDESKNISDGRLELILDSSEMRITESYKGKGTRSRDYDLMYEIDFYRAYTILSLVHDTIESENGVIDWEEFKKSILTNLLQECGIWENAAPINTVLKQIVEEKYFTFEGRAGYTIKPLYPLKGHVYISIPE